MDFLDYYSGDEENPQVEDLKERKSEVPNLCDRKDPTSLDPIKKRKKTLDIAILPKEIQDALTRGYVDSDEDDNFQHSKDGPILPTTGNSRSSLLALLPMPKSKETMDNSRQFIDTTSHPAISRKSSGEDSPPSSPSRDSTALNRKSKSSLPNISLLLNPNFGVAERGNGSSEAESVNDDNMEPQNQRMSSGLLVAHSDYGKNLKKKREREVEQQLMAGNTSVILNEDVPMTFNEVVAEHHTWDSIGYSTRQEREAAILSKYTKDGSVKGMIQPTKLQNRRHQLTSMALKAAETEIAMMDATTARRKTKAQTQAKYGW